MINLKNVMEVFVYFGIPVGKAGVFIDIFTHSNVRKSSFSILCLCFSFEVSGSSGSEVHMVEGISQGS